MSRQLAFDTYPDQLKHAVPLRDYLPERLIARCSPFHSVPRWRRFLVTALSATIAFAERFLRQPLLIENRLREFFLVDSRVRNLLRVLIGQGIVLSWQQMPVSPDLPFFVHCRIRFGGWITPSGKLFNLSNNVGHGTGLTLRDASVPALAEALERHSQMIWDERDLVRGSFHALRKRGAVEPSSLLVYSARQVGQPGFERSRFNENTPVRWVKAYSLTKDKYCLIPAQAVYFGFDEEYKDEPVFDHTTSNGAAAGATLADAIYHGVCEAVERDGLMIYWLNRLAPERVDVGGNKKLRALVERFRQYRLDPYILNTTTEIGIPGFCLVIIDRSGKKAVHMGACAGFDIERSLEKMLYDLLKQINYTQTLSFDDTQRIERLRKGETVIKHLDERTMVWAPQAMIKEIDFFLKGSTISLEQLKRRLNLPAFSSARARIAFIRKRFRELGMICYVAEVTSLAAGASGLRVVKTVTPDLVPMYFQEDKKPLGIKRLYEAPLHMGLRKTSLTEDQMNPTPHPFL